MSIPRYHKKVIFASSLGTAFEWYDFYLYGTLAGILGQHFLSGYNPTADFIVTLMLFAVGFVVRPFGALFFGRLRIHYQHCGHAGLPKCHYNTLIILAVFLRMAPVRCAM